MSCKRIRQRLKNGTKPEPAAEPVKLNRAYLRGPGSTLKARLWERYRIPACGKCHETAALMDEKGPEWCAGHVEELAEQLHENAQERSWTKLLDFVEYSVFGLKHYKDEITTAIRLHVDEVAKRDAQ